MNAVSQKLPIALLAAAVLLAGEAQAQSGTAQAGGAAPGVDADRYAQEMKEAEEQLADAARRVAELSAERLDQFGDERNFVYEISDKPRLGVNIAADDEAGPVAGVGVESVTPGSAADDAGLRGGDIITAINGESLSADSAQAATERLLDFMRGVEEGDKLKLEYSRDGKVESVEVEPRPIANNFVFLTPDGQNFMMPRAPEVHPAPMVVDRFRYSFGGWRDGWGDMEVVELTEGLGRYFGTDEGLLVISAPKTNDFRLEEGDVIQSIDGRKPGSVDHCMRILASYQPGESLELKIMRDQRAQTLRVAIPETAETPASSIAPLPAPQAVPPTVPPAGATAPRPEPPAEPRDSDKT
jgi:membrane-associated protease RseP (regulator of RpoE activity)